MGQTGPQQPLKTAPDPIEEGILRRAGPGTTGRVSTICFGGGGIG